MKKKNLNSLSVGLFFMSVCIMYNLQAIGIYQATFTPYAGELATKLISDSGKPLPEEKVTPPGFEITINTDEIKDFNINRYTIDGSNLHYVSRRGGFPIKEIYISHGRIENMLGSGTVPRAHMRLLKDDEITAALEGANKDPNNDEFRIQFSATHRFVYMNIDGLEKGKTVITRVGNIYDYILIKCVDCEKKDKK